MRHAGYAMSRHVQPRAKVCMPLCNKTTVCLVTQLGVPKKKKQEHRNYYACCLTIVGARKSVDKHRGTSIRCVDMLIWQALLSPRTCRVIIVMQLIGERLVGFARWSTSSDTQEGSWSKSKLRKARGCIWGLKMGEIRKRAC